MKRASKTEAHPLGTVSIDGRSYPLVYKVVTHDHQSLGLRKNPNILTFPVQEWLALPPENITWGEEDWGGIWAARMKSKAYGLERYMMDMYQVPTFVYVAAIRDILFSNSYRVKTDAIYLLHRLESHL